MKGFGLKITQIHIGIYTRQVHKNLRALRTAKDTYNGVGWEDTH